MRFNGKVAIVTGAAGSIGRAAALRLAREGARVLLTDIAPAGDETAADFKAQGLDVCYRPADVSDDGQVESLVKFALQRWQRLDVMVANAGISGIGTAEAVALADWDRVLEVNLKSILLCIRHAVPAMRATGGGAIVNTASVMGAVATRGAVPYCAAKGGVVNLTRATALDHAPENIRINAVCPGFLDEAVRIGTVAAPRRNVAELIARHPLGRLGRADEVAAAIAFLASDDASFITGTSLFVDGGYTAQ